MWHRISVAVEEGAGERVELPPAPLGRGRTARAQTPVGKGSCSGSGGKWPAEA